MMEEKLLGKIASLRIGNGGYQGAMFGVSVSLSMNGSGVGDFKGAFDQSIKVTPNTKWTEADRSRQFDDVMRWLDDQCRAAHVDDVMKLDGKPVEVTLEGNTLKSWRLLIEVL